MKNITNFIVLGFATIVFYYCSSFFAVELFEPYIIALIFSVVSAVIFTAMQEQKEKNISLIYSFTISMALYVIAKWMHAGQIAWYNECYLSGEGFGSIPLPYVTWGWILQILFSILLALTVWKNTK